MPTYFSGESVRLAIATAFVLIVLPATAKGQSVRIDALSLQAGARARILGPTTDSQYTLIKVASATPDSLHYRLDHVFETKSLAWQQISKMDASVGSHRHVRRDAGIGFLMGLLGGAAIGDLSVKGGNSEANGLKALATVAGGLTLGAFGGVAGAVLGFAQRTENWVPVTLPRTPVALEPKAD
jgi:hypothetical protein